MKNLVVQFTLAAALLFVSLTSISAQYSNVSYNTSSYEEIDETLINRALVAKATLEYAGYTVVDSDADYLKEKAYYRGSRTFYAGNDYVIMAFSSEGIYDLDLYLNNDYGKQVRSSTELNDDGVAIVEYTPYRTANMTIKAKNFKSKSSYKAYPMIILVAYK